MDFYYSINAADLTPLKTELVDLVFSCLMKEPPFDAVRPDQPPLQHVTGNSRTSAPPPNQHTQTNDGVAMVAKMRELVHLISRQDGEFVLKLALYTRRALHLRSSPNYLVALCAREPNCLPFLQPYMEQIVQIPSDWLAIANFAYFYDCDAAHDYSSCLGLHASEDTTSRMSDGSARSPTTATQRSATPQGSPASRNAPSVGSQEPRTSSRFREASTDAKRRTKPKRKTRAADPTRSFLPAALRTSLVHCFKKFNPFGMSKADNEAAEHRAHRRARKLLQQAQEGGGESSTSDSESNASDDGDEDESEGEAEVSQRPEARTGGAPERRRKLTFTYKLLIRKLHITEPAFLVCCLLGKRYPADEKAFMTMGLHLTDPSWRPSQKLTFKAIKRTSETVAKGLHSEEANVSSAAPDVPSEQQLFCVFAPSLAGTRMRLPVVQTWETLLSKEGNTGKVWDFLIASRAVAYMALLRNLRNILTRTCSAATHKLVLEKLVDEQQVALSQQLPYRFYSAYLAVKEVQRMLTLLSCPLPPAATTDASRGRGKGRGKARGGRGGRDRRGAQPAGTLSSNEERVQLAHASFENPAASRAFLSRYLPLYTAALDAAINTAARLNVIPMRGTSIVVLCVTQGLLEPMVATGAAAETASIQRKIDVAALLIAMMMRSCEQCVVLLYCYDEYVMFRESDVAAASGVDSEGEEAGVSGNSRSGWKSHSSEGGEERGSGDALDHLELRSSDSSETDSPDSSSPHQATPNLGFMALVDALVCESSNLLARKLVGGVSPSTRQHVATSFDMFAEGSGAQFPYAFLDEVIERSMRVESLLVFDEGEHRTYANMNRNAPAFGDLPTYLTRLRRSCSPDLVYVGVNLKASSPPMALGARASAAQMALQRTAVKQRFGHHNDLLLTGFSDAVLRLVAERVGGGPLSVVERAAETYQVARFSARGNQAALAERAKALKMASALREDNLAELETSVAASSTSRSAAEGPAGMNTATVAESTDTGPLRRKATTHTDASVLSAATAITLPSFNAQGKAVTSATWGEGDWGHRARRSERQLQQLTGSSTGLSSSPASLASFGGASGGGGDVAGAGDVVASGPATLPSIRRLFSKRSIMDAEDVDPESRSVTASPPSSNEARWLAPQGKQISPIFHPRPFISLVKLLSASAPPSDLVTADGASEDEVARGARGKAQSCASRVTSASARALHDQQQSAHSVNTLPSTTASPPSRHRSAAKAGSAVLDTPRGVVRRLLTSYRVCRFFISSTFLDMNNERNAITLDIFPRLRRWAAETGLKVTLLEVDLRWGIPAVATTRNLSTSVCLNEVSRCSPFFLGMVGARYGSCPPTPLQLVVDEDVEAEDYDWMTELTDPHVSVTELEMRHAMYNTSRRLGKGVASTALFFARDQEYLMSTFGPADGAARRVYEGDSATSAQSLATLRQRIIANGCTVTTYKAEYASPLHSGSGAEAAAAQRDSSADDSVGETAAGRGPVRVAAQSSTRAMQEDDLGRWAVRGGRALDAVGPASHTADSNEKSTDSLWSFVKARINESEEPKFLTSMDVPLDMSDFSAKVFTTLQNVIRRVCGVDVGDGAATAASTVEEATQRDGEASKGDGAHREADAACRAPARGTAVATASRTAAASPDLYETLLVSQSEYARKLSALYAAPRGLLEQLSSFALAGTLDTSSVSPPTSPMPPSAEGRSRSARRSLSTQSIKGDSAKRPAARVDDATDPNRTNSPREQDIGSPAITNRSSSAQQRPNRGANDKRHVRQSAARRDGASSILLVEGNDGDGKSSTLAALTERILLPMHRRVSLAEARPFLFYSTQAGDDSVRSLLFFLATSYRVLFHLYAEVSVQESDSVEQLLLALDQAYATIHRRYDTSASNGAEGPAIGSAALVVILDGLDKSSEAAELLSLLGTILHPLAAPHIRFIVSARSRSPLASALRTRTPIARVVPLPLLNEGERAQLVRLHLAAYGKLLEESFSADELKELLRKSGAGRPSRLISAITYLRLFSTFDTLREDIRSLPASSTQLYVKFFRQLQTRFDHATCRLVLTLLLLRQPVGGILEYNVYRLVSNVAVASRLVALLRGICLDSHHGRLFITSAAFVAAVAHAYLPFASDYQSAQERVLVAELQYQPVDMTMDEQEVRQALRRTREAIERNAADPLAPCLFNPERYAPRELLGVLQGSVQASRLDVTATLVCYLPFLECILINRRMLSQLVGLLSAIMHATKRPSDSAAVTAAAAASLVDDTFNFSNDADAANDNGAINGSALVGGSLPLQWRHYRNEVHRIGSVLEFLQTHYHILLRQPSLLRQCVWNALTRNSCISVYGLASTTRLRSSAVQSATSAFPSSEADADGGSRATRAPIFDADAHAASRHTKALDTTPSTQVNASALSALWVHWLNLRQHGGETRVQLTTASPQPIRCMAVSPDETEVALGSDDGFVRRVYAGAEEEEAVPPSQQQCEAERASGGGGGRRGLTSTLRHESAVTAVMYVAQKASGARATLGRSAGGSARATFSNTTPTSEAPHLLVSGCVRGIVYVWNLEDNSLLQRGTGHLRSISGLVCHPLEPSLLCTCSHDSYVMLWNLCGTRTQMCDEVMSAIALRLPKYPANSLERQQQQRLLSGGVGGGRSRGATAVYQSSLAAQPTAARPAYLTPLTAFHTERQHRTPVSCIEFHITGDIMASGSWDGALVLYNTRELCTPPPVLPYAAMQPPLPLAAARGACLTAAKEARKWRVRHGPEYRQVAFRSATFNLGSPVRSLSFSNSLAVTCVVGCHNSSVLVVDYASRAIVARWTSLHTAPITRVLSSPDSRYVASADEHGVVRLTYMGISGSVFATFNGHQDAVTGLGFRAQVESTTDVLQAPQQVLLSAGTDRTLQMWRVNRSSGPEAKASARYLTTSHSTAVTAVATSIDGQRLVTGSADGTAIVFCVPEEDNVGDWASEVQQGDDTPGTRGMQAFSRFSTRSTWASTSASSNSASAIADGKPMVPSFVLRHDECRITCITFALQDTRIVVGVAFGLVYIWSSTPGLNRIEGRLLLRVRVPERGLYPVISLGVRESASPGVAGALFTSELSRGVSGSRTESTFESTSMWSSKGGDLTDASASQDVREGKGTSLVTAVCANGDVAVLKLLSDAASRVMVGDQNRRRQQRRLHQSQRSGIRSTSSSSSSSGPPALERTAGNSSSVYSAVDAEDGKNAAGQPLCSPDVAADCEAGACPHVSEPFDPALEHLPHFSFPFPSPVLQSGAATGEPPRLPAVLKATTALIPRQVFLRQTNVQEPARRSTLDRRAVKLQRLLARCHSNEVELRENFQLDLHRHRLAWSGSADAEEITAIVWLSAKASAGRAPQPPRETVRAGVTRNSHSRLALVVVQRRLFLMLSTGCESAVSGGLTIRVLRQTPDSATTLRGEKVLPEEGATAAASASDGEDGWTGVETSRTALQQEVLSSSLPDKATPAATHDLSREVEVDVDYLLSEDEYFTAASAAVTVATATSERSAPSPNSATTRTCRHADKLEAQTSEDDQRKQAAVDAASVSNVFVVALTTSLGEILLLRIQVPLLHRKDACTHHGASGIVASPKEGAQSAPQMNSAAAQLAACILPSTQVHLCRRLGFGKASTTAAATEAGAGKEDSEAAAGPATAQRTPVTPLATAVQLSALPGLVEELHAHEGRGSGVAASTLGEARAVEQVALVAGCSDGSARVWLVPTSPFAARGRRCAEPPTSTNACASIAPRVSSMLDVPLGSFFCSSAVSVASPLMQLSSVVRQSRGLMHKAAPVSLLQPPRWVVGDSLGNIYQLQLERDAPGGVTACLRHSAAQQQGGTGVAAPSEGEERRGSTSRGARAEAMRLAASTDRRPWASSLRRLVSGMDHPPTDAVLQAMLAAHPTATMAGMAGYNNGDSDAAWATGASQTPADWLTSVDFSTDVASHLLRRSRRASLLSGNAGPPHETVKMSAARPSFCAAESQQQSCLPREEWSILPALPSTLRTTTSTFSAASAAALGMRQPTLASEADAAFGEVETLATTHLAPPAALPSFGTQEHRTAFPPAAPHGRKEGSVAALSLDFEKPLKELLSAYRCNGQGDERVTSAEEQRMPQPTSVLGSIFPSVALQTHQSKPSSSSAQQQPPSQFFLRSNSVPSARETAAVSAPVGVAAAASTEPTEGLKALTGSLRTATKDVKPSVRFDVSSSPPPSEAVPESAASSAQKMGAARRLKHVVVAPASAFPAGEGLASDDEAEEENYFGVLYMSGPPASSGAVLSAETKHAWFLQQQEVLKEAMRVQRYNKEARAALKAYQQRLESVVNSQ